MENDKQQSEPLSEEELEKAMQEEFKRRVDLNKSGDKGDIVSGR